MEEKKFTATLHRTTVPEIHSINLGKGGFHGATVCAPPNADSNPGCTTPHQLFIASVGTCVNIIFEMAVAKARIKVLDLTSNIEATYETNEDMQSYFTDVHVNTTITVPKGTNKDKIQRLFDIATKNCPIGNSLQGADCTCVDLKSTLVVRYPD
jgi:uncharacterized OsmC-like protein